MNKLKNIPPMIYLAIVAFIAVVTLSIVFEARFFDTLPLLISTVVMFMQTRVNRYAFILGGLNSIIYAAVYVGMGLYGSAASAFLISFPLQIITFINWQRNTHKGTTEIKRFSTKARLVILACMAGMWALLYVIFSALGSAYLVLDNTVTVIGVVAAIICILRYCEFAALQIMSSAVQVVLYASMTTDDKSRIIYLVYSVYCLICVTVTFIKARNGIRSKD